MIVAVTGATGFVGRHLVHRLRARGHQVRCLVRDPARLPFPLPPRDLVRGDLADPAALRALAAGAEAVVHLVGIIAETRSQSFADVHVAGTRAVLAAAKAEGVPRVVHMSAVGARAERTATSYHRTKWEGETLVRESARSAAILRPAFIVGPENVPLRLLARLHRLLPAVPVFGDGQAPLQPIWIGDVTAAFATAVERPDLVGAWDIGGPAAVPYVDFVRAIGRALSHPRPVVHVPLGLIRLAARAFDLLPAALAPITTPQLQMLLEGAATPHNAIEGVFGVAPLSLQEALARSLSRGPGAGSREPAER